MTDVAYKLNKDKHVFLSIFRWYCLRKKV